MQLFYDPLIVSNISEFELNEKESFHAYKVLRYKTGDLIKITNGKGEMYQAKILSIGKERCILTQIELIEKQKKDLHIHLGIGIIKKADRMEWLIEKAIEVNCHEITPLETRYTEKKKYKTGRLQNIVISAMKQSCCLYLPQIHEPVKLDDFIKNTIADQKIVAHETAKKEDHLFNKLTKSGNVLIVIGPEGGISNEELFKLENNGFKQVSLGRNRMRSETAALVSLILTNAYFETTNKEVL